MKEGLDVNAPYFIGPLLCPLAEQTLIIPLTTPSRGSEGKPSAEQVSIPMRTRSRSSRPR